MFISEELCRKHGWILSSLLSFTGEPSFLTKQSLYGNAIVSWLFDTNMNNFLDECGQTQGSTLRVV